MLRLGSERVGVADRPAIVLVSVVPDRRGILRPPYLRDSYHQSQGGNRRKLPSLVRFTFFSRCYSCFEYGIPVYRTRGASMPHRDFDQSLGFCVAEICLVVYYVGNSTMKLSRDPRLLIG